jgi:hypothetical protein
MSTFNWPAYGSDKAFWPASVELQQWHNNMEHESPLSGDVQTSSTPGAHWGWVLNFDPQKWAERARLWAFLTRLNGKQHRVALFAPHLPTPKGTINLSGVTLGAAVAQFADTCTLNGCGAGATLLRGDWFSFGGQPVMSILDRTANGSGVMTGVEFRHPARAAASSGAAVVTNSPTGLYILTTSDFGTPYGTGDQAPAVSVAFREVFSA